jgi:ribulose-5-phosphate 4-epimerase/fuculose-1-phosphate aldolase
MEIQKNVSALPQGFELPKGIPLKLSFGSHEESRQHRKLMLAASFRIFSKFGFSEGVAGHITARDPEFTDCFWVNPFGLDFSVIKPSDLILVNHKGEVVEGKYSVNRAAFAIHSQVHAARPDAVAAAHSHSVYGKAFSSLGKKLDPITQDACAFYEDHGLFNNYTGVVNEAEEGQRIAKALDKHKACILQNHGLLTVGQTVEEAVWWFVTMDRSCQAQLLAEATGSPTIKIDHETALLTRSQVGFPIAGFFQFQPLYQRIVKEQADFLE